MAASSKCAVKGGEGIGPERQDVAGEWQSACGKGRGIERGGGGACRVKLLYGGRSAKLARYMNGLGISRQIGEPQQPSLFASLVGQSEDALRVARFDSEGRRAIGLGQRHDGMEDRIDGRLRLPSIRSSIPS